MKRNESNERKDHLMAISSHHTHARDSNYKDILFYFIFKIIFILTRRLRLNEHATNQTNNNICYQKDVRIQN